MVAIASAGLIGITVGAMPADHIRFADQLYLLFRVGFQPGDLLRHILGEAVAVTRAPEQGNTEKVMNPETGFFLMHRSGYWLHSELS